MIVVAALNQIVALLLDIANFEDILGHLLGCVFSELLEELFNMSLIEVGIHGKLVDTSLLIYLLVEGWLQ